MTSRWAAIMSRLVRRNSVTSSLAASVPTLASVTGTCPLPRLRCAAGIDNSSIRCGGVIPPGRQFPSWSRTSWPLTVQTRRSGSAGVVAAVVSRPRNSQPVWTGTPAQASSATAVSRARSPWPGRPSQATIRWGRSPSTAGTSPLSTWPGPASTKTRAPSAYIASICSTNRTGAPICAASPVRTRVGVRRVRLRRSGWTTPAAAAPTPADPPAPPRTCRRRRRPPGCGRRTPPGSRRRRSPAVLQRGDGLLDRGRRPGDHHLARARCGWPGRPRRSGRRPDRTASTCVRASR